MKLKIFFITALAFAATLPAFASYHCRVHLKNAEAMTLRVHDSMTISLEDKR